MVRTALLGNIVEETLTLRAAPLRIGARDCASGSIGRHRRIHRRKSCRIGLRHIGGQAGLEYPFAQHQRLGFGLTLHEIGHHVLVEQLARCRLEGVIVEPLAQPIIEAFAADHAFHRAKEEGALIVGDRTAELVSPIGAERSAGGILADLGKRFLDIGEHQRGFLLGALLAIDRLDDAVLEIGGHALVEPAVAPHCIGHEIARPAVRQFVRDEAVVRPVARDECRRKEGHHGVFHPAIGESGRQDDHIVAPPAILAVKLFRRDHHFLGVVHFAPRAVERSGFGPDTGARTNRLEVDIARRDRDEIGRHRLVHHKGEGAAAIPEAFGLALSHAAHHHVERLGCSDPRFPCLADAGAVLSRNPGAVEDCLPLTEEEGVHPALGLFGAEPLQRAGIFRCAIGNAQRFRPVERDRQRSPLAAARIGFAHRVSKRAASTIGNLLDLQPVAVEDDLLRAGRGEDGQFGRSADALGIEIERKVERDMRHACDLRLRIGQRIDRFGGRKDGRNHAIGPNCRRDRRGFHRGAGGAGQKQGERGGDSTHWVVSGRCMPDARPGCVSGASVCLGSRAAHDQTASGGRLIRIASILPPVLRPNNVPRS